MCDFHNAVVDFGKGRFPRFAVADAGGHIACFCTEFHTVEERLESLGFAFRHEKFIKSLGDTHTVVENGGIVGDGKCGGVVGSNIYIICVGNPCHFSGYRHYPRHNRKVFPAV